MDGGAWWASSWGHKESDMTATNTAATRLPAVVVLIFKLAHNKCSKMGMIVQVFIRTFFFGKDFCSLTNS